MAWLQVSAYFLALSVLLAPSLAAVCPDGCVCITTRDGLHRATCSNLPELYKFTLRQKHHNINILDLSHNNITKITHELDRLTEVVTLDLSTNRIANINKFLHNAKKLVHLNLANNRLQKISLTHLPASVSSLDLTNNLLQDVPSDFGHLISLEHLELEGNPLDCSCENIRARDRLILANVFIDKVKCASPSNLKGRSWLELKVKDVCKVPKSEINYLDMMMGDQPIDAEVIGEETTALKSMALVDGNPLGEASYLQSGNQADEDDSHMFLKVDRTVKSTQADDIEGSGDTETTTDIIEPKLERKLHANLLAADEILPADNIDPTEDPLEGSGEGSGFGGFFNKEVEETTTPTFLNIDDLQPDPVKPLIVDEPSSSTEFPPVVKPTLFAGGGDWLSHTENPVTEKMLTTRVTQDTTVSEKLETQKVRVIANVEDKTTPHKTGTYVCIAVIVVLLVGLIGFAVFKSQMRKRRDRRLIRQQKRDVEKASKEMVDMNKSLLGKPAIVETPVEKKLNGKYELVPTHESHQKKSGNGELANGNGVNHVDSNGLRTDSPRDSNQNKSSSKDNNLADESAPIQDTSFESAPSPDSRKDSLSSEDIFVPMNDEDAPRLNGTLDSDISQPLINGDQNTDSDFLSPSREYVPVYSPDMGRVRIKMTETPKPKTPVLVTRSRSNAGDIIITPTLDGNARKSTT
ncbi:protein windpipe [Phthorimaea operculella]|nr:protein windpipe [Phthorimaea operculella]